MLQENDKIQVHMFDRPDGREIVTHQHRKIFSVLRHPHTGQLCVEWGAQPYNDDPLLPLSSFAPTVIFENIETGAQFHWDTRTDSLAPL